MLTVPNGDFAVKEGTWIGLLCVGLRILVHSDTIDFAAKPDCATMAHLASFPVRSRLAGALLKRSVEQSLDHSLSADIESGRPLIELP